ncbi:D-amino-acid transaminase [Cohnella rhizosphaerae]|uniref:D-alanine aminotransferase n=1 Tax=Cohnella rhizosphaerae TaxID=1457232 RepID=A0A9X4KXC5_9BACL|nr:D-amino-acid transaminase [Cohnella rhizosphaerae]MDG0812273.1 D-amino-acid transaminase [Cohnella rhizosphaerae]
MTSIYWHDNAFLPEEDVRISPHDRGYNFGDGIYEVFRVYGGKIFEAEAHFERLRRSAEGLKLALPWGLDGLRAAMTELVERNALSEGTVYLQITRGTAPRNHLFPADTAPSALAYTREVARPVQSMERGISVVTLEDIRWLHCNYKTLNLLANVLAKQEAADRGAADAVLHRDGVVTESSASNVMIVKDGLLITHPADNLILHGVTRAVALRLAQAAEIPYAERPFTLDELYAAEEAFVTGTTVEITPIVAVDGREVGSGKPGPITRRLQREFAAAIGR